ncbi:DUF6228 family protein [Streptomyces cyaneofuscatus]
MPRAVRQLFFGRGTASNPATQSPPRLDCGNSVVIVGARGRWVSIETSVRTWDGDGFDSFLSSLAEDFRGWEGARTCCPVPRVLSVPWRDELVPPWPGSLLGVGARECGWCGLRGRPLPPRRPGPSSTASVRSGWRPARQPLVLSVQPSSLSRDSRVPPPGGNQHPRQQPERVKWKG